MTSRSSNISRAGVAAAVVAGLSGAALLTATPAVANSASDRTVIPGVRVGAVYGLSTRAQLRRIYGRNIVFKKLPAGEGTFENGAIIFRGTTSEIRLFFRDGHNGVRSVRIPRRSTRWRTRSRVLLGANIMRVVELNGRHFRLQRENDGHNCTSQWRRGRLSPNLLLCFREARRLSSAQSNRISRHKGMHTQLRIVGQVFVVDRMRVFLNKTRPPRGLGQGASSGGGKRLTVAQARCKRFLKISSRRGGAPMTITFVNRSGADRNIIWLNYQGRPKNYATLAGGQRKSIRTFAGHHWAITDGPGNCLEIRTARRGRTVVTIRPDNRDFGPE